MTDDNQEEQDLAAAELEQERSDFAAAYGGDSDADEYVAEEEYDPEDEEPEPVKETASVPAEDDLRRQLAQALELNSKLEGRVRNMEGRYGSLNSQLTKLSEEKSRGYKAPTKEQLSAAMKSVEAIDELKEAYPEWADEVEAREALTMSQLGINSMTSKEEVEEMLSLRAGEWVSKDDFRAILEREKEELRVEFRHPGWIEDIGKPEFAEWMSKQEESVSKLFSSSASADAIKMLDIYKRDTSESINAEKQKEDNAAKLERSISATSSSGRSRRPVKKSEHDDFLSGYGAR